MSPAPHTTDEQLGADLGASLRSRVEQVPTVTPGFDGVERRAARITRRRRALAGVATAAVIGLGGLGVAQLFGDDESTTDTVQQPDTDADPVDDGPLVVPEATLSSALVVVDGDAVVRHDPDGTAMTLHESDAPLHHALLAPNGDVLVVREAPPVNELRPVATEVVAISVDGAERVLSADGVLAGVDEIDGRAVAFVGDIPDFLAVGDDQASGDLRLVDLGTGESTVFVEGAYGIEWSVSSVDVRPGRVLTVSGDETGPGYGLRDLDGAFLADLPHPFDGRYGDDYGWIDAESPAPGDAVLSADGDTLYWLESPPYEWDETGSPLPIDTMRIRSLDLATGEDGPTIEIPLPDAPTRLYATLDHDGTAFIVNPYHFESEGDGLVRFPSRLVAADGTLTVLDLRPGDHHFVDG